MSDAPDLIVPPMLYLPVLDHAELGTVAAVRQLEDGRLGLLAYTALDRLAAACGSKQPWMLMSTPDLEKLLEIQRFDVVAFDIDIPPALRDGERLIP